MPRSLMPLTTLSLLKALAHLHIIGGVVLALLWWLPRFHPALLTTLYMEAITLNKIEIVIVFQG